MFHQGAALLGSCSPLHSAFPDDPEVEYERQESMVLRKLGLEHLAGGDGDVNSGGSGDGDGDGRYASFAPPGHNPRRNSSLGIAEENDTEPRATPLSQRSAFSQQRAVVTTELVLSGEDMFADVPLATSTTTPLAGTLSDSLHSVPSSISATPHEEVQVPAAVGANTTFNTADAAASARGGGEGATEIDTQIFDNTFANDDANLLSLFSADVDAAPAGASGGLESGHLSLGLTPPRPSNPFPPPPPAAAAPPPPPPAAAAAAVSAAVPAPRPSVPPLATGGDGRVDSGISGLDRFAFVGGSSSVGTTAITAPSRRRKTFTE